MIVGVDAGGTNVDAVLVKEDNVLRTAKVPQTGTFAPLTDVLEDLLREEETGDVDRLVIASTLVLNAQVENRFPGCTGYLIPGPGLDPDLAFFADQNIVLDGCVDHRGRITEELNSPPSPDHDTAAVVAKFSPRNPRLEEETRDRINSAVDHVRLGHRAGGRLGFPARARTTVLNAKAASIFETFSGQVEETLESLDLSCPVFYLKGDAAMVSGQVAQSAPSITMYGGPAASSLGLAALTGEEEALCMDIGGTTTDLSRLDGGFPVTGNTTENEGKLDPFYRVVDSRDIAVGGDTAVDEEGLTGERRGDAVAFGGTEPTPTDALHVTGEFTEGDVEAARDALSSLGSPERVASRILEECTDRIVGEVCEFVSESVPDTLVAGGVLAPYFAHRVVEELNEIQDVEIPEHAPVSGAAGCAAAEVSLRTDVHIDSAQGTMSVSATGEEQKKHVQKGRTFEGDELREIGEREARRVTKSAGGTPEADCEITHLRHFNVVQSAHVKGQIADITAQARPGYVTLQENNSHDG